MSLQVQRKVSPNMNRLLLYSLSEYQTAFAWVHSYKTAIKLSKTQALAHIMDERSIFCLSTSEEKQNDHKKVS